MFSCVDAMDTEKNLRTEIQLYIGYNCQLVDRLLLFCHRMFINSWFPPCWTLNYWVFKLKILKEEVRDLLNSASESKSVDANGHTAKVAFPGKPTIQIREASNGVITLAGSTEVAVSTLQEMAACLEKGSLSRATGSTNMNNQSR